MVGICSYGGYVPRYRLNRMIIYKAIGWMNPGTIANAKGEKAVGNVDEDSLTMAVAAGMDALKGVNRSQIDGLFFASTTTPYTERLNAGIATAALGLEDQIRAADFTGGIKAGTTAMISAIDTVSAGSLKNILVCATDRRLGKPASSQEMIFGDAAAAFKIGTKNVIAKFKDAFSITVDFPDHWRASTDTTDRQWEDRFIRDNGYVKFITEAFTGLLKKSNYKPKDLSKVIYPCLYPADFKKIAKIAGLTQEQVAEPLLAQIGYAGAADAMLHLAKELETAKAGDLIVVISYGSGADALLFEVTNKIGPFRRKHRSVSTYLTARRELTNYEKMVAWSRLFPVEKGIRGENTAFTALSDFWRNRDQILGLYGSQCQACQTPQFPAQRVCANPDCGAVLQMKPYRFSDKQGTLLTYTGDNLAYSMNPPAIYGTVEFNGGGRFWFDITDIDLDDLKVGMPVEMSFRKKYVDEKFGIHGYFWKAVPVPENFNQTL